MNYQHGILLLLSSSKSWWISSGSIHTSADFQELQEAILAHAVSKKCHSLHYNTVSLVLDIEVSKSNMKYQLDSISWPLELGHRSVQLLIISLCIIHWVTDLECMTFLITKLYIFWVAQPKMAKTWGKCGLACEQEQNATNGHSRSGESIWVSMLGAKQQTIK